MWLSLQNDLDDGDDEGGLSRRLMALLVEEEMIKTSRREDRYKEIRGGTTARQSKNKS